MDSLCWENRRKPDAARRGAGAEADWSGQGFARQSSPDGRSHAFPRMCRAGCRMPLHDRRRRLVAASAPVARGAADFRICVPAGEASHVPLLLVPARSLRPPLQQCSVSHRSSRRMGADRVTRGALRHFGDFWRAGCRPGRSLRARDEPGVPAPQNPPVHPRAHTLPLRYVNLATRPCQRSRGGAAQLSDAKNLRRRSFTGRGVPTSVEGGNGPSGVARTRLRSRRTAHHFLVLLLPEQGLATQCQTRIRHGANGPRTR